MNTAVLFSYSYETSEAKLIQELPVMMEARFEVFGKETFLVSNKDFYRVSDSTFPIMKELSNMRIPWVMSP